MITASRVMSHFTELSRMPMQSVTTDGMGGEMLMEDGFNDISENLKKWHKEGNTAWFIGNGGSAGIASHMATDYSKNGGIRALSLNDASSITCLANDMGYEQVFAFPLLMNARACDTVFAVSSSGASPNILKAVEAASERGCFIYTFSGFNPDNPLRKMGDINFYVPSQKYGFVEVTHLAILHAILDLMTEVV